MSVKPSITFHGIDIECEEYAPLPFGSPAHDCPYGTCVFDPCRHAKPEPAVNPIADSLNKGSHLE